MFNRIKKFILLPLVGIIIGMSPTTVFAQDEEVDSTKMSILDILATPSKFAGLRGFMGFGMTGAKYGDLSEFEAGPSLIVGVIYDDFLGIQRLKHSIIVQWTVGKSKTEMVGETNEGMDYKKFDIMYRFLWYGLQNPQNGLGLLMGPNYVHVEDPDPNGVSSDLIEGSVGVFGYIAISNSTRLGIVGEADLLSKAEQSDFKLYATLSFPFGG